MDITALSREPQWTAETWTVTRMDTISFLYYFLFLVSVRVGVREKAALFVP